LAPKFGGVRDFVQINQGYENKIGSKHEKKMTKKIIITKINTNIYK